MIYIEILIGVYLLGSFIHFQLNKRKTNYQTSLLTRHIDTSDELKKTLAMGLYLRFRKEKEEYTPVIKEHSTFIKEDPLRFEEFVANTIQAARGGETWVTPSTGDYGVDFEHETEDGKFLGQVKCKKDDMDFEAIAILHSNMVKQEAKGGYVITTSSFTTPAKAYAKSLNIELIDGVQLVDLWLKGLEDTEKEIKTLIPDRIR